MQLTDMHFVKSEKTDTDSKNFLRPMHCEINVLTRSDGSAMLTQGDTAVMASVDGPIEVKLQNLQIDRASVEVYYRPKVGLASVGDRLREQIIRNTCEAALLMALYPRTAISVQLQEMEDRAGLIACAINAACLSLLNSGLAMKYLVGAVHCIIDKDNQLILDPDQRQAENALASLTFAFDSVEKNTVAIYTSGHFTIDLFNQALNLCRDASDIVFDFYKNIVKKMAKVY